MKKYWLALALILGLQVCNAQTWDEWWQQKKTQIEYLLKQIAALKVYTDFLEKGYEVAKDGTQLIGDIKHGDFSLHRDYFSSLTSVSPAIKNFSRASEIISMQVAIISRFKKLINYCHKSNQFTSAELDHINSVYKNLTSECQKQVDQLILVTTSGELQMKDDERINRIEKIYIDMKDKYLFAQSYFNETSLLAFNRTIETIEISRSKQLSDTK